MLTYKGIQDYALTLLDQAGDTSQGLNVVKLAIQSSYEKRLTAERWSFMLWPQHEDISFVTDTRRYTLHPLVQMVATFYNHSADQWMSEVPTRSRMEVRKLEDRFHFEWVQDSPIKLPKAAGKLTVTGAANIYYTDTDGEVRDESITSGNTTTYDVDEVLGVTSTATASTLVITDSADTTLLSLASGEFGKTYPQIHLYASGKTGETGRYRFYRRPKVLSHNNDIPEIPFPFSRILVYDALLELYTYNDAPPPPYWIKQQAEWETQLRQAYQEGEMEGSEARTIHEVDEYGG